jgi:hypothetical protein
MSDFEYDTSNEGSVDENYKRAYKCCKNIRFDMERYIVRKMINKEQHYRRFRKLSEAIDYLKFLEEDNKAASDGFDRYISITKNNSYMYCRKMNGKLFRFKSKNMHAILNYKLCKEYEQLGINPDEK